MGWRERGSQRDWRVVVSPLRHGRVYTPPPFFPLSTLHSPLDAIDEAAYGGNTIHRRRKRAEEGVLAGSSKVCT